MEIPRITVRQVATRLAGGQEVIFLDARSEEDWQRAALQIPGSLRAPPDRLERLPAMPDDPVVVAYCTWLDEGSSARVALKLREFGQEAYALAGGFDAWIQAGLPVVARDVVPELASQI